MSTGLKVFLVFVLVVFVLPAAYLIITAPPQTPAQRAQSEAITRGLAQGPQQQDASAPAPPPPATLSPTATPKLDHCGEATMKYLVDQRALEMLNAGRSIHWEGHDVAYWDDSGRRDVAQAIVRDAAATRLDCPAH